MKTEHIQRREMKEKWIKRKTIQKWMFKFKNYYAKIYIAINPSKYSSLFHTPRLIITAIFWGITGTLFLVFMRNYQKYDECCYKCHPVERQAQKNIMLYLPPLYSPGLAARVFWLFHKIKMTMSINILNDFIISR